MLKSSIIYNVVDLSRKFMACESDIVDNFKTEFKYYKQKASKPNFDDVIDIDDINDDDITVTKFDLPKNISCLGLKPVSQWNIYHINKVPGLYIIRNPFSDEGKSLWIKRSLEEYSCSPHKTNIDETHISPWKQSLSMLSHSSSDLQSDAGQLEVLKSCPIWKLRWATLGLHHNWNTKHYCESQCSDFPEELNKLSCMFASAIGWNDYKAEAAIVNFYHVGSTLSPHTDHSEKDLTCPLVSISFGLSAIFLIGGASKSEKPDALLVRSGDVIIMSGSSRLAYHAVPRIIECTTRCPHSDPTDIFISHSRININVRQFKS